MDASEEPDYPFKVVFGRVDAVELDYINSVTVELERLSAEHDGLYDGWETHIVRAAEREKKSLWTRLMGWFGAGGGK